MMDTTSKWIAGTILNALVITSLNLATGGVAPLVLLALNIVGQVMELGCGYYHSKMVEIATCVDSELYKLSGASFGAKENIAGVFKVDAKKKQYIATYNGVKKEQNKITGKAWRLNKCKKLGEFFQA